MVAVHGAVLALGSVALPEVLGGAYFAVIVIPALFLAWPLTPLLWQLHLMEAPGWFAWPKPFGFVLVYTAWIIALFGMSFIFRKRT